MGTPASARAKEDAEMAAMVSEPSADSRSTFRRTEKGNWVAGRAACRPRSNSLPMLRLLRFFSPSVTRSRPSVLAYMTGRQSIAEAVFHVQLIRSYLHSNNAVSSAW